jgi:hypothetical protein
MAGFLKYAIVNNNGTFTLTLDSYIVIGAINGTITVSINMAHPNETPIFFELPETIPSGKAKGIQLRCPTEIVIKVTGGDARIMYWD